MCLKCKLFYERKVRRIGRLPNEDEKPNCEQHWLIKVTKFTKSLTIDKKNAAIETINSLGYTFCDGEMAEEKISKIFEQKKQDVDADDLMSSGGSLPCSSVESFETLNNSGINPESSNVSNDSQEDTITFEDHPSPSNLRLQQTDALFLEKSDSVCLAPLPLLLQKHDSVCVAPLPSLSLRNPETNCHALRQPVPFAHATEGQCDGTFKRKPDSVCLAPLPLLNLRNPQSNCHALRQPVPFAHATEEPCEGSGFLNLLGSAAALESPVVPKASTLKPHETVVPRNYLSRLQNE